MKNNEETMAALYRLLGRIFYVAAQADGVIREEEIASLKTTVRKSWLNDAHLIEIVFDELCETQEELEDVLLEVREFKRIHPSVLNSELVEQIMSTSYTIVSAFAKRNKSELVFLSQLRFELEK